MAAGSRSSGLGGAVMKRKTTLSMVMLAGCAYPAGLYRLETMSHLHLEDASGNRTEETALALH